MNALPRRNPAVLAAIVLMGTAVARGQEAPPPAAPIRILSTRVARLIEPAVRALSDSGALPPGRRPAGLQVGAVEIRVLLADDGGDECTVRLGAPTRPDAVSRGRWFALLPDDDSCSDDGRKVLDMLEGALPEDPWAEPARSRLPPWQTAPALAGPTAPRPLVLAAGAFGILVALLALVTATVVAFRPDDPAPPAGPTSEDS